MLVLFRSLVRAVRSLARMVGSEASPVSPVSQGLAFVPESVSRSASEPAHAARFTPKDIPRLQLDEFADHKLLDEPHFRVGEKEVWFPKGRITLLRPNAKHTPYQAKFYVPRLFNKLDLRDYLWHVYGLRTLKITTQLLHSKFVRGSFDRARYRPGQRKKMTIEMEEPFVWPEPPKNYHKLSVEAAYQMRLHSNKFQKIGSDRHRPTGAFGGLYDKQPDTVNFLAKKTGRKLRNAQRRAAEAEEMEEQKRKVAASLGLRHD